MSFSPRSRIHLGLTATDTQNRVLNRNCTTIGQKGRSFAISYLLTRQKLAGYADRHTKKGPPPAGGVLNASCGWKYRIKATQSKLSTNFQLVIAIWQERIVLAGIWENFSR
jgi:hypothetical protein